MEDRPDNVLVSTARRKRSGTGGSPTPIRIVPPGRPNSVVALVLDPLTIGATARIYVAVIRHLIPFDGDVSMEAPVVVARRKTAHPQRHHHRLRP